MSNQPGQPAARPEHTVLDAQATLNRHLSTAANEMSYARRRDPPKLRQRDGSLWYEGSAFFAVIMPDGTVKFSDIVFANPVRKRMLEYPPGLAAEYIEVVKRIQDLLTINLPFPDLTDMVARISDEDPYAAEKRWFLQQTDDVRRKLAHESHVEEQRKARRLVLGKLSDIVESTKLTADDKRTAVFAVWEMCTGDGEQTWQRVVEAFIRRRMSRGSELGYSPELLARLNRTRTSAPAFEPYREQAGP
jgi:hypothetical protein